MSLTIDFMELWVMIFIKDASVAKKILSSDGASTVSYERCEEIRKKIMDR